MVELDWRSFVSGTDTPKQLNAGLPDRPMPDQVTAMLAGSIFG